MITASFLLTQLNAAFTFTYTHLANFNYCQPPSNVATNLQKRNYTRPAKNC